MVAPGRERDRDRDSAMPHTRARGRGRMDIFSRVVISLGPALRYLPRSLSLTKSVAVGGAVAGAFMLALPVAAAMHRLWHGRRTRCTGWGDSLHDTR